MKMNENLRKIVDYQLLYSPYMRDIGLFHGKMGVVIALYMYSTKYHDELISEYTWDLFQQIYDGIYSNMSIGLEYGANSSFCRMGHPLNADSHRCFGRFKRFRA